MQLLSLRYRYKLAFFYTTDKAETLLCAGTTLSESSESCQALDKIQDGEGNISDNLKTDGHPQVQGKTHDPVQ